MYLNTCFSYFFCVFVFVFVLDQLLRKILYLYLIGVFDIFDQLHQIQTKISSFRFLSLCVCFLCVYVCCGLN